MIQKPCIVSGGIHQRLIGIGRNARILLQPFVHDPTVGVGLYHLLHIVALAGVSQDQLKIAIGL